MKIFIDANIIVSVLNKEYPSFPHTSRILSLGSTGRFQLFTSPLCLAIAFYFAGKKVSQPAAKEKIHLLSQNMSITEVSSITVKSALENPAVKDFEDGLQYYSAVAAGCQCIVTDDHNDFYFSQLEVLGSSAFYNKYMARA